MWEKSQFDLHEVIRWKKYLSDGVATEKMVPQSTLQHTLSFSLFSNMAVMLLSPHVEQSSGKPLDEALLQRTFNIHDLGEGLIKRDVLAHEKTAHHDLEEYLAFLENISSLPSQVQQKMKYAFLLQFAIDNPEEFPKDAREMMDEIRDKHYYEMLTFKALERFEYLFYPIWMEKNHPHLLTWVIRNQLPSYQEFTNMLPGFRQEIFTHSIEKWMYEYLDAHKDLPDQNEFYKLKKIA